VVPVYFFPPSFLYLPSSVDLDIFKTFPPLRMEILCGKRMARRHLPSIVDSLPAQRIQIPSYHPRECCRFRARITILTPPPLSLAFSVPKPIGRQFGLLPRRIITLQSPHPLGILRRARPPKLSLLNAFTSSNSRQILRGKFCSSIERLKYSP